jgi:hypothetical protein
MLDVIMPNVVAPFIQAAFVVNDNIQDLHLHTLLFYCELSELLHRDLVRVTFMYITVKLLCLIITVSYNRSLVG